MEFSVSPTTHALRALGHRVIVEVQTEEQYGSLIIPDSAKDSANKGIVVQTGPGKRLDDGSTRTMMVTVGDRVLIGKYSGIEIEYNGQTLRILYEDDVLAIVEPAG
jgi:chaperonin GroES